MGWRYRKSVRICKGVRVNFSKSGTSVTVGGHGHTVNYGPKGTRVTVGIPGTGVSYSKMVSKKGQPSSQRNRIPQNTASRNANAYTGNRIAQNTASRYTGTTMQQNAAPRRSSEITMVMNQDGKIILKDAAGRVITDAALIRRIQSSSQYQYQKQQLEMKRQQKTEEMLETSRQEHEELVGIYKHSASVSPRSAYEKYYDSLQPEIPQGKPYEVPPPKAEDVRAELEKEAEETIHASRFRVKKLRTQYVEDQLYPRYKEKMDAWNSEKEAFLQGQEEELARQKEEAVKEFEIQKKFLRNLLDGKSEEICSVFDSWLASCELPVEIEVHYDWQEEKGTMYVDLDLPEIEDLPETVLVKNAAGNLREKKKTQKELRSEYATVVFGLAVFISSYIFILSPAVQRVLLSGYTQRRDKEGNLKDEYIYSIKFKREMFEGKDVASMEPIAFCMEAENRCNMTSTSLLRKIKPYDDF